MTTRPSVAKPPPLPASPTAPSAPSPRTPSLLTRSFSGFNSPSLSNPSAFRADDEIYIYHLSSTSLTLGLGGENVPRSSIKFDEELQQRPYDFDQHSRAKHGYFKSRRKVPKAEREGGVEEWGRERELYSPDLRGLDLGLVGDTLERAIRQANVQDIFVLDEQGRKRQGYVVVSSALPQPLLQVVLQKMFQLYPQPTTLTLVSESVMCAVAAGLRSALVVDIGWHETTVSAISEYREVRVERSQCAGKRLSWEMAMLLQTQLRDEDKQLGVTQNDVEEVLHRMAWCRKSATVRTDEDNLNETKADITLPSLSPTTALPIPFQDLSAPAESALFTTQSVPNPPPTDRAPLTPPPDDNLTPLPLVLYNTLLHLPPDIRGQLYSRITFTGGCSNVPGLKPRILTDLASLIRIKGWSPVANFGRTNEKWRGIKVEVEGLDHPSSAAPSDDTTQGKPSSPSPPDSPASAASASTTVIAAAQSHQTPFEAPSLPPSAQEPSVDPILSKLQNLPLTSTALTTHTPREKITLRAIKNLGPWAGASLLSGLRVKGAVEIERDQFLKRGLAGLEDEKRRGRDDRLSMRPGSPVKRVSGVSPEKRRSGVSPEKRRSSMSPVKRKSGVSPEKKGRMSTVGVKEREGTGLGVWG